MSKLYERLPNGRYREAREPLAMSRRAHSSPEVNRPANAKRELACELARELARELSVC